MRVPSESGIVPPIMVLERLNSVTRPDVRLHVTPCHEQWLSLLLVAQSVSCWLVALYKSNKALQSTEVVQFGMDQAPPSEHSTSKIGRAHV